MLTKKLTHLKMNKKNGRTEKRVLLLRQPRKRREKGNCSVPTAETQSHLPECGPHRARRPVQELGRSGRTRVRPRRAGLPGTGGFRPTRSPHRPRDQAASDSTRGQLRIRGADLSPAHNLHDEDEEEESHAAPERLGGRPRARCVPLHGPSAWASRHFRHRVPALQREEGRGRENGTWKVKSRPGRGGGTTPRRPEVVREAGPGRQGGARAGTWTGAMRPDTLGSGRRRGRGPWRWSKTRRVGEASFEEA